jgi:hypothetical protein
VAADGDGRGGTWRVWQFRRQVGPRLAFFRAVRFPNFTFFLYIYYYYYVCVYMMT